jgi:hypothetical protein
MSIKPENEDTNHSKTLQGVGGHVKPSNSITLKLKLGKYETPIKFLVVKDLPVDVLIGHETLRKLNIDLLLTQNKAVITKGKTKLYMPFIGIPVKDNANSNAYKKQFKLYPVTSTTVPAGCETLIECIGYPNEMNLKLVSFMG